MIDLNMKEYPKGFIQEMKLPEKLVADGMHRAETMEFMGVPLAELSKDELMAVAALSMDPSTLVRKTNMLPDNPSSFEGISSQQHDEQFLKKRRHFL